MSVLTIYDLVWTQIANWIGRSTTMGTILTIKPDFDNEVTAGIIVVMTDGVKYKITIARVTE